MPFRAAYAARSAVVIGIRAARTAGRNPPTMPIATAMTSPVTTSGRVT